MFNLANKLTLLRMLLVPLVIVLLYFEGPVTCVLATLAFIAASITDWADGYVARRNNMVTSMGKFLDPAGGQGPHLFRAHHVLHPRLG